MKHAEVKTFLRPSGFVIQSVEGHRGCANVATKSGLPGSHSCHGGGDRPAAKRSDQFTFTQKRLQRESLPPASPQTTGRRSEGAWGFHPNSTAGTPCLSQTSQLWSDQDLRSIAAVWHPEMLNDVYCQASISKLPPPCKLKINRMAHTTFFLPAATF